MRWVPRKSIVLRPTTEHPRLQASSSKMSKTRGRASGTETRRGYVPVSTVVHMVDVRQRCIALHNKGVAYEFERHSHR